MPVFSFEKIRGADISLGPEMKSTGECLGIAKTFNEALYKAFEGAGVRLPKYKNMIITVRDSEKEEACLLYTSGAFRELDNAVRMEQELRRYGYNTFLVRRPAVS